MSIRPDSPARDPRERVQREHELHNALEAARTLQARLELLGDRQASVRWLRTLRDDLAAQITLLDARRPLDRAEETALTHQALRVEDEVAHG